ncbi:MAG: glycosyltransferase family 2 protein [Schleiferiaceae bacterium]
MDLSVLIVNYNVKAYIDQCLRSVERASQGLQVEVIVVDNASSDGSVAHIQKHFPWVTCIASPENLGFGRANNLAAAQAKGEFVLYLNPDTVVPEDNFRRALEVMRSKPEIGSMGCRMIDGSGHFLPESKRGLPTPAVALYRILGLAKLFPKHPRFGAYYAGHLAPDASGYVDVHCGAWMLMRGSVLHQIGGFDEAFFMYGEDIDLSYRVLQAGHSNYYLADSPILHYKGESTKHQSWHYIKTFHEAMAIFANKHFHSQALAYRALISLGIYAKGFATLTRSWGRALLPFLLTLLIGYVLSDGLSTYWERNHRYVEGGAYPERFRLVFLPLFAVFWTVSMAFLGAFSKSASLRRVVSAFLITSGVLLAGYAFLPMDWRFSRALVALFSLGHLVGFFAVRTSLSARGRSGFFYRGYGQAEAHVGSEKWPLDRIALRVLHLRPKTLFFHPEEHSYQGMIDAMVAISALVPDGVRFRMVYPGWTLGSDTYTSASESGQIALAQSSVRRQKRLLDLFIAALTLGSFPLLIWTARGRRMLSHLLSVLQGQMTWVGYIAPGDHLPPLQPGVFQQGPGGFTADIAYESDLRYAETWRPELDVYALFGGSF